MFTVTQAPAVPGLCPPALNPTVLSRTFRSGLEMPSVAPQPPPGEVIGSWPKPVPQT